MHIRLTETSPGDGPGVRVAFLHEGRDPSAHAPKPVRASLKTAIRDAGFRGKEREIAWSGGWMLCGLGEAPATVARLRTALRRAVRDTKPRIRRRIVLCFDGGVSEIVLRALLPQIALADYAYERYKTRGGKPPLRAGQAVVLPPPGLSARSLAGAAREAEAIASAVTWARDVGNTPGNDLGPLELAREAKSLAAERGFRLRVLDRKEIEKEKMGGLLGVNAGSARPPVFLVAEHAPAKSRGTVVLVGKGITFDTGGISLKPAASMGEMKYDMMGAATALACLRLPRP